MSLGTHEPMSIKSILRSEGKALGGTVRADTAKELDDAMFATWSSLVESHDGEHAALALYAIVSLDPSFRVPLWLAQAFRRHRAAIVNAHDAGVFSR